MRVDLGRRQLDLAFDFVEREGVVAAFVPITLAVDGVKIKPGLVGGIAPVVALGAGEALHRRPLAAAMGVAAMSMKMPMEPVHPAAEAAIGHAAIAPCHPDRRPACYPGPQSLRGTKPIDTAPTAAVPIMVRTTRRERFMVRPPAL